MLETKRYNKIADNFMPRLKSGEVAIYVCAKNKTVDGIPRFPTVYLPIKDLIQNPDDHTGGVIDIAYITQDAPEGREPLFGTIVFEPTEKGIITLMHGRVNDARQYAYMELSDFNGDKPGRDESKQIYYHRRRPGQASADKFANATRDAEALVFARDTELGKLRELMSKRIMDAHSVDEASLRSQALDEAKKKAFTVPKYVAPPEETEDEILNIGRISEMFEADILKWSVADKCIINAATGEKYPVDGLLQTDKMQIKQQKLLSACLKDKEMGYILRGEIKKALNI